MALLLLQLALGVGLAAWLWHDFASPSAPNRLPPRTVAVIVLGALAVTAVLGVTAVIGHEGLASGVLLGLGAAALVAAPSDHAAASPRRRARPMETAYVPIVARLPTLGACLPPWWPTHRLCIRIRRGTVGSRLDPLSSK